MAYMALGQIEFQSWRSYWAFARATMRQTRYVRGPEAEAFLETVRQTAEKRAEVLPPETYLWRAQLGNDWDPIYDDGVYIDDQPAPHPPARMKPLTDRAPEGRANPKGIPYLYLATDRDTAMAEVRPWIGSYVSVGQFKTLRGLRLVNCTTNTRDFIFFFKEPSPEKREEAVWLDIDRAFAKPVSPSDDLADYVPTQVIAELFKTHGYDGIAYRSSLGAGHNIMVFDLEAAELVICHIFQAESITFSFKEAGNYYLTPKYTPKTP